MPRFGRMVASCGKTRLPGAVFLRYSAPAMQPQIIPLLRLQERDQKIRQFQKDLKDIPAMEARARARLAGDLAAEEKALAAMREVEVAIKNIELDVQTRRTTIKRLQDQQFETRKNDEFQALGHEIERYQKEISTLEDRELEQMLLLDDARAVLDEARGKLAQSQAQVDQEIAALAERAANVRVRLTEVEAERAGLTGDVPADDLEFYQRIFKKKGDSAVVPLVGETCGGCHMRVVIGTLQQLKQAEGLVQCESCGRILYIED
jgi:predicted  nucleic acid-binding Zn-ribbon protein